MKVLRCSLVVSCLFSLAEPAILNAICVDHASTGLLATLPVHADMVHVLVLPCQTGNFRIAFQKVKLL